jgi:hypothetical protein
MKKTSFVLLTILLAVPAVATAQHQATIGLSITDPRGQFDRNTDTGFGFTGAYLYALTPNRSVAIGATGTLQTYGSVDRRAALSGTIPDITVDVETDNQTFFLQGLLQLKAPTGVVQPYIQGNGGFGWFFTTTSIDDPLTNVTVLSDTNQDDWTWIWGGGGGLMIRVYEGQPRAGFSGGQLQEGVRDPVRAYIDLGARYVKGNEVEYLREGSLVTDDGEFNIDRRLARSEIELIQYQIAVTVEF